MLRKSHLSEKQREMNEPSTNSPRPFVANKWVSSSISKPLVIKDSSSPNAQEMP